MLKRLGGSHWHRLSSRDVSGCSRHTGLGIVCLALVAKISGRGGAQRLIDLAEGNCLHQAN